jgi:hypothetical protein
MAISFGVGGDQAYKTLATTPAAVAFYTASDVPNLQQCRGVDDDFSCSGRTGARRRACAARPVRKRVLEGEAHHEEHAVQLLCGTASLRIEAFPEGKQRDFPSEKTTRQSEKSDFSLGNAFFLQ